MDDNRATGVPGATGTWITANGYIRLQLSGSGRFKETWGAGECAYDGSYAVSGAILVFTDDSGLVTLGELEAGAIHLRGDHFLRVH